MMDAKGYGCGDGLMGWERREYYFEGLCEGSLLLDAKVYGLDGGMVD